MTTNTSPDDHRSHPSARRTTRLAGQPTIDIGAGGPGDAQGAPRPVHLHDPSELLAETALILQSAAVDSLVIYGCGGPVAEAFSRGEGDSALARALVSRSDLGRVMSRRGPELVEEHFCLLQERGCDHGAGMLVLGTGREELPELDLHALCSTLGTSILALAARMLPEPFGLEKLWLVGDGRARCVVLQDVGEEGIDVAISPEQRILPFEETEAAALAVLRGESVAGVQGLGPAADVIARALPLGYEEARIGALPGIGSAFLAACSAVGRLGAAGPDPQRGRHGDAFVTDCERIAELLRALAEAHVHWDLLAFCVAHGNGQAPPREDLIQQLTQDGRWAPHADVRAGGAWFEALENLRDVADAASWIRTGDAQRVACEAWRGLTVVLMLLSWWGHRGATAAGLVDELWEREPGSTLAPLLSGLLEAPIPPAWWPAA